LGGPGQIAALKDCCEDFVYLRGMPDGQEQNPDAHEPVFGAASLNCTQGPRWKFVTTRRQQAEPPSAAPIVEGDR
jgi:hypothetical protein